MPQRDSAEHDRERGDERSKGDDQGDLAHPEHCDPLQAAPAGIRQHGRRQRENARDDDEADVVLNDDRNGLDHIRDAGGAVDAEIRHDRAGERQRLAAHPGHGGGGEDARRRPAAPAEPALGPVARRAAEARSRQRCGHAGQRAGPPKLGRKPTMKETAPASSTTQPKRARKICRDRTGSPPAPGSRAGWGKAIARPAAPESR